MLDLLLHLLPGVGDGEEEDRAIVRRTLQIAISVIVLAGIVGAFVLMG